MRNLPILSFGLILVFGPVEATAAAVASERGSATLVVNSKSAIVGFTFASGSYPVVERVIDGQPTLTLSFVPTLTEAGHTLIVGDKSLSTAEDLQRKKLNVILAGVKTQVNVVETDASGARHEDQLVFVYPEWEAWALEHGGASGAANPYRFFASLSPTFISYRESGLSDYRATTLTLKAGVTRRVASRWEASVSGYGNPVAISRSEDTQASFYGLNVRVGYRPSFGEWSRWHLTINAGYYFTTMVVTADRFGFKNMSGPQLFPVLVHALDNGNLLSAYAKFSPVSSSQSGFSFTNREAAVGIAHHWLQANNTSIIASIDISSIALSFANGIVINSSSYSAGVGYAF